jgi:hypothetical protein
LPHHSRPVVPLSAAGNSGRSWHPPGQSCNATICVARGVSWRHRLRSRTRPGGAGRVTSPDTPLGIARSGGSEKVPMRGSGGAPTRRGGDLDGTHFVQPCPVICLRTSFRFLAVSGSACPGHLVQPCPVIGLAPPSQASCRVESPPWRRSVVSLGRVTWSSPVRSSAFAPPPIGCIGLGLSGSLGPALSGHRSRTSPPRPLAGRGSSRCRKSASTSCRHGSLGPPLSGHPSDTSSPGLVDTWVPGPHHLVQPCPVIEAHLLVSAVAESAAPKAAGLAQLPPKRARLRLRPAPARWASAIRQVHWTDE